MLRIPSPPPFPSEWETGARPGLLFDFDQFDINKRNQVGCAPKTPPPPPGMGGEGNSSNGGPSRDLAPLGRRSTHQRPAPATPHPPLHTSPPPCRLCCVPPCRCFCCRRGPVHL
jgi:hypothetical protein